MSRREDIAAQALRFTILTACRTNETLGAIWDEMDLPNKLWTLPPARVKSRREHKVPLSDTAIELLQSLPTEQGNPFVFIGGRDKSFRHGRWWRCCAGTNAAKACMGSEAASALSRTNTPRTATTRLKSVAHSVGSEVERSYRRTDLFGKRHQLMQVWNKFVAAAPVKQVAGDKVVGMDSGDESARRAAPAA